MAVGRNIVGTVDTCIHGMPECQWSCGIKLQETNGFGIDWVQEPMELISLQCIFSRECYFLSKIDGI